MNELIKYDPSKEVSAFFFDNSALNEFIIETSYRASDGAMDMIKFYFPIHIWNEIKIDPQGLSDTAKKNNVQIFAEQDGHFDNMTGWISYGWFLTIER